MSNLLLSGAEVGLEAACRSLPAGLGDSAEICRIVAACQALRGEAPAAGAELPARRGDPTAYAALLLAGDAAEIEAALAEASAGLDMVAHTGNRVHAGYLVSWATARLGPGTARGDGLLLAVAQEARARGSTTLAEHARLALAIDDVAAGRFDEAAAALAAAQTAPGAAPGAWTAARLRNGALAGAQMKLWRGRHLEAMDEAAAVSAHPDAGLEMRSRAKFLVGLAAVDSERWELLATGWRALDSLPTAASKGEEAVLLRALLCLADGRRAKATALVEPLARTSESAVILARVARVLRQAGRPGLAREVGKRALALLEIDPGRAGEGSRQLASAIEWAAPGSAWAPFLAFDPTLAHALAGLVGGGAVAGGRRPGRRPPVRCGPVHRGLGRRGPARRAPVQRGRAGSVPGGPARGPARARG